MVSGNVLRPRNYIPSLNEAVKWGKSRSFFTATLDPTWPASKHKERRHKYTLTHIKNLKSVHSAHSNPQFKLHSCPPNTIRDRLKTGALNIQNASIDILFRYKKAPFKYLIKVSPQSFFSSSCFIWGCFVGICFVRFKALCNSPFREKNASEQLRKRRLHRRH